MQSKLLLIGSGKWPEKIASIVQSQNLVSEITNIAAREFLKLGTKQVEMLLQGNTLWIATTCSLGIEVEAYKDFLFEPVGPSQNYKLQPPDATLKAVYGPSTFPVTRETAVWDKSLWQGLNVVPIRVGVAVQSCAQFAFGFKTSDDVVLIGYEVEFTARGTRTIAGHRA